MAARLCSKPGVDSLPRDRDMPQGDRPGCHCGPRPPSSRDRQIARGGRVGHAGDGFCQYQRRNVDDRRESCGDDPCRLSCRHDSQRVPALAAEARASPERLYCQHRSGSKSASERLEQIGKRFVTAVLENQRHIAIFARKEKDLAPEDYRRISEMRRTFDHKLVRLLDAGVAAGEFHIADTRLAALAIGGMVLGFKR